MVKNKAFLWQLVLQVLCIILSIVGYVLVPHLGWLVVSGLSCIGIGTLYTGRRYKDIKKLTVYIDRIQHGIEKLDIRDNQ